MQLHIYFYHIENCSCSKGGGRGHASTFYINICNGPGDTVQQALDTLETSALHSHSAQPPPLLYNL